MNKEELRSQQAEMRERTKDYRRKITFRKEVHELFRKGLTYAEIALKFGVTRQYIQYLVRPPKAIYELVVARAQGRCQDCKVEVRSGHVHHANPNVYNFNEPDKLMYLCPECHSARHFTEPTEDEMTQYNFARRVLYYKRKKKALTDIAAELGVSAHALYRIVNCHSNPSPETLKKIIDGVSIRDVSASSATLKRIRESMATPSTSGASS